LNNEFDSNENGILVDEAGSAKRTNPASEQCEVTLGCYTPPKSPPRQIELQDGTVSV
jgi:hypothetical protein